MGQTYCSAAVVAVAHARDEG